MRTVLCAVLVLIASAGICVRAEGDAPTKITQADPTAPAATPGPAQSGASEQKLVASPPKANWSVTRSAAPKMGKR